MKTLIQRKLTTLASSRGEPLLFQLFTGHALAGSRGDAFDLQALYVVAAPEAIVAGSSFTALSFLATNATNGSASGDWFYDVYLSTNDNIGFGDTHLSRQNFNYSFGAMNSVRVGTGGPITIPPETPAGTYWVGVELDMGTDMDLTNNDTDGWDAARITVCTVQGAPTDVSASDGEHTNRVLVTWTGASGAMSYDVWRNTSSDTSTATQIASSVGDTSYDDYSAQALTEYYYWVKAENVCGSVSGFSDYDTGWRLPGAGGVPTIPEWGLVVMTLLTLTAGTMVFRRRDGVCASQRVASRSVGRP